MGFSPDEDEELRRVVPVIRELAKQSSVMISIDTMKASVARWALARGAAIVNDVWGLQRDADMAHAVAEADAHLIVMHNRHSVEPEIDIGADMRTFTLDQIAAYEQAGDPRDEETSEHLQLLLKVPQLEVLL